MSEDFQSEFQGIFIGLIRGVNMFIMANVVDSASKDNLLVKGVARVFEIAGEGRVGYQFHPDPYFTTDSLSHLDTNDFMLWRIEENHEDKMAKDYFNFMQQLRMQKAGLIAGAMNPDKAKLMVKDLK